MFCAEHCRGTAASCGVHSLKPVLHRQMRLDAGWWALIGSAIIQV